MGQGVVLGKKLQNPYSVSNMKKALAELNKTKKSPQATEADIVTMHYYVKFIPLSDEELNNLKSDSLIITYPYPLDYKLLNESSINTTTNEYYASVPVHHPLPKTNYEILEHLFIPDEEKDNSAKSSNKIVKNNTLSEDLVSISLKLTGNEDDKAVNIAGRRSSWRPTGRITMEDTISQLEDALRSTNNWLGWRNNIIPHYDNPTENNLTETFYFWASKHKNY